MLLIWNSLSVFALKKRQSTALFVLQAIKYGFNLRSGIWHIIEKKFLKGKMMENSRL